MVKIAEISRTSTFAWSHDSLPLLAAGTVAGAVDVSFSSQAVLEIWDVFSPIDKTKPVVESHVDARFHAIAWSKPFDSYSKGVIAGGFENGVIEFWDANILLKSKGDLAKASILKNDKVHTGFVKSLLFHPTQDHVLVSGGDKGQILVWDLKNLNADPKLPGSAMTPMEVISSVAWNQQVDHIFALTGNSGYTSIWDLKAKREVLHLSYTGTGGQSRANFSCVAWHPTQLTKLITASDNDGCPLILTWDLRNSNAPEKVLAGHTQGVLSLDWCSQDPEILISSGKDNSTMLWNPITGEKLGEYPTTANWAFQTKFAPQVPDIFATASFDGKIIIQSLQDTSPPVSSKVSQTTGDDNQFWTTISSEETQQPTFTKRQAPKWLKTPVSVNFGFGSKLVSVKQDANGKSVVEISKFVANSKLGSSTEELSKALKTNDFKPLVEAKDVFVNDTEREDWGLLKKLATSDSKKLLQTQIRDEPQSNGNKTNDSDGAVAEEADAFGDNEDSFFDNLGSAGIKKVDPPFVPSGSFDIFNAKSTSASDSLIKLILDGQIDDAVSACLEQDLLVEAVILALDGSKDTKDAVRNSYFKKNTANSLSRLIYSALSKDVTDIVVNADVKNWKQIAASISAYSVDKDDFNHKITELGDRILAANDRENAIICYLAGGALDKISLIWLDELSGIESSLLQNKSSDISSPTDARFEALNNFVSKLAAYRSISNITGTLSGPGIEKVCKALLEYSSLIAGFGEFELAEKFLEFLPEDFAGLKLEKERIYKALGKTPVVNNGRGQGTRSSLSGISRVPASAAVNRSPAHAHVKPRASYVAPNGTATPNRLGAGSIPPPPTSIPPPAFGSAPPPAFGSSSPAFGNAQLATNPYAAKAPVANPYAPLVTQGAPVNHYKPIVAAGPMPSNTFTPPPPPIGAGVTSIPPPPTQPAYKKDEGGWNDLPDTFKPKVAPRRANAVTSPSPVASPQPNINLPKRNTSAAAPVLPPPPKGVSRTSSKQNIPSVSSPSLGPATVNTRYAPPQVK